MAVVLDILDGMYTWDAYSLQEIIRTDAVADSDASGSFTLLHTVDKGRHSATLGSRTPRCSRYCRASPRDNLHRRDPRSPHMLSAMSKAINASDNTMRSVQLMSAHMPSLLGHIAEEIDQVIFLAAWCVTAASTRSSSALTPTSPPPSVRRHQEWLDGQSHTAIVCFCSAGAHDRFHPAGVQPPMKSRQHLR